MTTLALETRKTKKGLNARIFYDTELVMEFEFLCGEEDALSLKAALEGFIRGVSEKARTEGLQAISDGLNRLAGAYKKYAKESTPCPPEC